MWSTSTEPGGWRRKGAEGLGLKVGRRFSRHAAPVGWIHSQDEKSSDTALHPISPDEVERKASREMALSTSFRESGSMLIIWDLRDFPHATR